MKKGFLVSKVVIVLIYTFVLLSIKYITNPRGISLLSNMGDNGINLIPFATISHYLANIGHYNDSIILGGLFSFFMFVPLAIIIGCFDVFSKNCNKVLSVCLIVAAVLLYTIIARVLLLAVFDIDSVVLRVVAAIVCYILFTKIFLRKAVRHEDL